MQLFSCTPTVQAVDPDGKRFHYVSRSVMATKETTVLLDHHSAFFMPSPADRVEMEVYSSKGGFTHTQIPQKFQYVMGTGIVYKKEEGERAKAQISFSGLLLQIEAPQEALSGICEGEENLLLAVRVI
jgi:RNA polymerase Rpb8